MKAMKAGKSMKAVEAMKAKQCMKDGQMWRELVFDVEVDYTTGRLYKRDLVKVGGKVMSKKLYERGKTSPWIAVVVAARKALGIKGFVAIKKGSPLHKKAKALYKK